MRMRGVNVNDMCKMHLRREHTFLHKIASMIIRGESVHGYIFKGILDINNLFLRHSQVENELYYRRFGGPWLVYPLSELNLELEVLSEYILRLGIQTPPTEILDKVKDLRSLDSCLQCVERRNIFAAAGSISRQYASTFNSDITIN